MPSVNIEKTLETLKEIYQHLSFAYRRGDFERVVHLTAKNSPLQSSLNIFSSLSIFIGDTNPTSFRSAAVKLFETAQELGESCKKAHEIEVKLREEVTEYVLLAQTLSYEIMDYFLITDADVSKHFLTIAKEASRDVEGYYQKHYSFITTPRAKEVVVKQIILGALSGVNAFYRTYAASGYSSWMAHVKSLIEFLEESFPKFCGRNQTAYGLLGLAYFLKGRLLLSKNLYADADDCFRESADNYLRKLLHKGTSFEAAAKSGGRETVLVQPLAGGDVAAELVEVSVGELLALRRAALVLAFGRGYSALINSRIKEAISFLILARGILYFNSPSVYSSYIELLYLAAKRAEGSNDPAMLEEVKKGVEGCRRVFNEQVPGSHYPHRAAIEHSLVLHYLAQHHPGKRAEYYREAARELEVAVEFAKGDNLSHKHNEQLYAETCYILSHILRYQSADLAPANSDQSIRTLKEAFRYAKEAEEASRYFPRHKCEALLALCSVYAEIDERGIALAEVDPQAKPNDTALICARSTARRVLEINNRANHRVSGTCYLLLADNYLKNPNTYSRAFSYWSEWLKIRNSIEHAFVHNWAVRIEAELMKVKERNLIIDLGGGESISDMRDNLNAAFAKRKIIEWVEKSYRLYKRTNREHPKDIVRQREAGVAGRDVFLKTDLQNYLVKELNVRKRSEVSTLIKQHNLLSFATDLIISHLG
jgi:hypothetical protein